MSVTNEILLPQNAIEGEIFSIKVKGNPTTGYSWFLINEEELINAGVIPLNLNEYKNGSYISKNPKGMVGGGGIFDFQFKVNEIKKELPHIILKYRRPWIPENDEDTKLEIKIL
ncbi:hypothetical protein PIROE2DRAFT_11752 [Piromyces sp. E2]|nr:hypothetical protein PIROE2DRAFT_11752 [Piromyces sp. E2]|eukprot:OUM62048.1 hypothetical protein PIROE2DRAFT_11752 [Piromyces sp. E2]